MKRALLIGVLVGVAAFAVWKFAFQKTETVKDVKEEPMVITGSDSLTTGTATGLKAYYELKDAFVKTDTALVTQTASVFASKIEEVQIEKVQADTSLLEVAKQLQETVRTETMNVISAAGIENKRKAFQALSDAMFDLLRTIRYSGSVVYQQYCPMAFNNTGAAWLSNSEAVLNPYFGEKMLQCGEVRDSIKIEN